MKKYLLIVMLFNCFLIGAQSLNGVIISSNDKNPIGYATIALLKLPDSTLIKAISSQANGNFSFDKVTPGKYFLKTSFIGYSTIGKEVEITSQTTVKTDTIYMDETTQQIGEVVVKGQKIQGKEMVDRTVYSIPGEVAKASPNAYDLLKKVPSIQVDYNDNVTLNGSANFIIQVDGKERDKEFLARLQPSDIESIEVITNPSAKYEGNINGIINVKLKKEARYGFSGNINAGARPKAQTSANFNGSLDYAMGNATVYLSAFTFFNDLNINSITTSSFLLQDSNIVTTGPGTYKFLVGSVNAGLDYYIDKHNTLSLNTSYKPLGNPIDLDMINNVTVRSNPAFYQLFNVSNFTGSGEYKASAFYKREFSKPMQELSVEAKYYNFNQEDRYETKMNVFNMSDELQDYRYRIETNDSRRNTFNIKADYVHPLSKDSKIETGAQVYVQGMNYNTDLRKDTVSNLRGNTISLLNNYNYNEWRQSGYIGFTTGFGKFSIQGMGRLEHSNIDAENDTAFNYFTFLPTVNFLFKMTDKQNFKLTYNRRINRPGLLQLNPAYIYDSNDNISTGNPGLKPELRDKFQLTYTLNIDKSYISPYIYHELYKSKIDNLNRQEGSPAINFAKPFNLLTGYEQGIGINAMIYFININYNLYKGHFDEYIKGTDRIASTNYQAYSINGWIYIPLPWKLSMFAFANYQSKIANAQGSSITPFFYGTGLRKEIKNHSLGLFYLLPGISDLTVFDNKVKKPAFNFTNKASFDARYFVQLTYSYKFNRGKTVKKVNRNGDQEGDTKKGGIGAGQ